MKDYEELFIALRRITRAIDLHSKKAATRNRSNHFAIAGARSRRETGHIHAQ